MSKIHGVTYKDDTLRFEENLWLAAPSKFYATSSMVLLFELFSLKSKNASHDQVFGWGVFPLLDHNLNYNSGKFKVLSYNELDTNIIRSNQY